MTLTQRIFALPISPYDEKHRQYKNATILIYQQHHANHKIQKTNMNVKFLVLGVGVMLMVATESSNAFVKRALRKKQDEPFEVSEEELDELLKALEGLEELVKNLEAAFGDMAPFKRMLRKRQEGDDYGISEEEWEDLLDALEQLEQLAKDIEAEFGEKKRRRRR